MQIYIDLLYFCFSSKEDENDIPESQKSSNLPSSGSLYMPSQASETSSDNTGL